MIESQPLSEAPARHYVARKVAIIGSGSWGTAVTRLVSPQVESVVMWS
jgi:hypothetical protein